MEGDIMKLTWNDTAPTVFTEVSGTFTFQNDDIRALYVDWGDGESNKKEEANYQWVQTTEPTSSLAVSHTYSQTGTFNPIIQTVNSAGFFSKYYGSGASNSDVSPYAQGSNLDGIIPVDGNAIGVMRVENRSVKSGIDNSIMRTEGPKMLFLQVAPTLTATELNYINDIKVDIEAMVAYSTIDYSAGVDKTTIMKGGSETRVETLNAQISGTNLTGATGLFNILASGANGSPLTSGAAIERVLSVKYKNPKYVGASGKNAYTENEVYNRLKIFLVVQSDTDSLYYPVTYVSAGAPIKRASDLDRNVVMDFSQSRAKASNVALSKYRYDLGKGWFNPTDMWGTGSATTLGDSTRQDGTLKRVSYTYLSNPYGLTSQSSDVAGSSFVAFSTTDYWRSNSASPTRTDLFVMDSLGRFPPQNHLLRMSTQPSSSAAFVSSITANKPNVFRITPAVNWPHSAGTMDYSTKILDSGTNNSASKDYTTQAFNNITGAAGLVNLSGMNTMSFKAIDNSTNRVANEYILLLFDKKTNKPFFEFTNYASGMQSTTFEGSSAPSPELNIAGVYYLALENSGSIKQNATWKALEFTDGTQVNKTYRNTTTNTYSKVKASFSKSGPLSFDMPTDWSSTTLNNLAGGVLSGTYANSGTGDVLITGTVAGAVAGGSTIGEYQGLTVTAADFTNNIGTAADVGSFKYLFYASGGAESNIAGSAWWLSKDGDNGWNGTTTAYLHLGDKTVVTAPAAGLVTGSLRRINMYDVFDGFGKVWKYTTSTTKLPMVDASGAISAQSFPFLYTIDAGSTIGTNLISAWGSNEKYALKIVLSGKQTTVKYPELWNIFDATEAHTAISQEMDDSAYNLNSLPVVSDIALSRTASYFQAITRKGKVIIKRTGSVLTSVSFSSAATGKETFSDGDTSTLYGHLRILRDIQETDCNVYWDEPQKDGTFARLFGLITSISETAGAGGPRAITNYSFNMTILNVALIDSNGELMTDLVPLGGIDDRDYT